MKKSYVCPQTDIQNVETGILCSSCGYVVPGGPGEDGNGGSIGGGSGIF